LSSEGSRKFIHIVLANWWILAMFLFRSNVAAAIGPFTFVILNYLSYKNRWFSAMEREGGKEDLGTVYYAVSLLILALIAFSPLSSPEFGAFGILIMGYGDGMAAVVGRRFGKRKFSICGSQKSLEGSFTMFAFSFLTSFVLLSFFPLPGIFFCSFLIASVATILEAITPHGFDNLTVPIGTSLFYWFLLKFLQENI
jgi:phytol kinase